MTKQETLHQAIRSTTDPMALMDRIVAEALELVPAADGVSLEIRRDADTLEYLSAAGSLAPFVGLTLPIRQSLSGLAVLTGSLQLCDDALDDERVNAAAVRKTGVRSMLCVPLSGDSTGVAVLKVSSTSPRAFTGRDARSLNMLARFLVTTVDAASQLASVTADLLEELERAGRDVGDPMTGDHEARFIANVMTPGLVDRADVSSVVEDMLANDDFEVVLQPIVSLETGAIVSCEALSRFRGQVRHAPDWWFAAAHRAGLGVELEERAVRKALEAFAYVPDHVRMAINVGVDLLLHPDFASLFRGQPMHRLTIELTEHLEVTNYDLVIDAMEGMRARGARLSVDDTGSGYSGLTHILRLAPDVIKLDRELVTGIDADQAKRALATALVAFARDIGAYVVAEGIETREEADCLQQLGADYGQGYFYARPMSPANLTLMAGVRSLA